MNGKLLVDTNVVVALFASDPSALERLERRPELFLCVPVLGELRYGALASSRVEQNLTRLDRFAQSVRILPCDAETVLYYAAVRLSLRRKGRPIPENDIWIAAVALQHGLTVLSRDSHFSQVDGLEIESV